MATDLSVQRVMTGDELARINRWVLVTSAVRGTVHTVNNILQTIGGQAELVGLRPDLPEDVRRRVDRIAVQTGRAAGLMHELSSLGRETRDPTDRADLRQVVERVLDLRQYDLSRAQVALDVSGEPAGVCIARIGARTLTLMLLNLVLNAEQALSGTSGGRITMTVGHSDAAVRVSVQDNGPGIPAEDRERIFEPFFTTGRPGATLGLGLTVARMLAQEHAGRLTLAETDAGGGRGARFDLELPAAG